MSRLTEILGFRPKQTIVEQPIEKQTAEEQIQPATGEAKKRLESDCIEYFNNPEKNAVADFLNFTSNMVQLTGGKREKRGRGNIFTSSNPLLDKNTNTYITFRVKDAGNIAIVEITARDNDKSEEIWAVMSSFTKQSLEYNLRTTFYQEFPEVDSYITGKKEAVILDNKKTDLEPDQAKSFTQRVFGVYQRQQTQPSTPLN